MYIQWKINEKFDENKDFTKDKTNFSFALLSNCGYGQGRMEYLNSLGKYITVDIFGKCGKPCPNETREKDVKCNLKLYNSYLFYFAFENSFCNNYVENF